MNQRGQYGRPSYGRGFYRVGGEGSILPHTPGDVEDELDQLNKEILIFGQQIIEEAKRAEARVTANPEYRTVNETWQALSKQLEGLPNTPAYDAQKARLVDAGRKLQVVRGQIFDRLRIEEPLLKWKKETWDPFTAGWRAWISEKKDIPMQMWPGSGAWDRIQDYRTQFINLRANAPIKATGPMPTAPRKDPDVLGGIGDVFKDIGGFLKYGVIGVLGIGAVVALSSVAHNLRKGEDPAAKYMEVVKRRRSAPQRGV